MNGFGVYEDDLSIYEGDFLQNKRQGQGQYSERLKKGQLKYLGMFENDVRAGFGKLEDGNSTYVGGFEHDGKSGLGFLKMDAENSYYGYWNDDQRSGYGLLIQGAKETKAEWLNDQPHGLVYCSNSGRQTSFAKYVHGKQITASPGQTPSSFVQHVDKQLPNSFFQYTKDKIISAAQHINSSLSTLSRLKPAKEPVDAVVSKVKELQVMSENALIRSDKDRNELRSWLARRGIDPETLQASKTWEIEDIKKKAVDSKDRQQQDLKLKEHQNVSRLKDEDSEYELFNKQTRNTTGPKNTTSNTSKSGNNKPSSQAIKQSNSSKSPERAKDKKLKVKILNPVEVEGKRKSGSAQQNQNNRRFLAMEESDE